MNTVIKKLSSGYEVEVRPVPPTAYLDVEMQFTRDNPPLRKPTIKAQSVAGHTEEIAAALDSQEYQDYEHALALRDMELRAAKINFAYNYAVVRWRHVFLPEETKAGDSLLGPWYDTPPDEWKPDRAIPDKTSDKRTLFIKYELIQILDDDRAISNPHQTAPMTEEEIAAALAGFQPNQERPDARASTAKRKRRGG